MFLFRIKVTLLVLIYCVGTIAAEFYCPFNWHFLGFPSAANGCKTIKPDALWLYTTTIVNSVWRTSPICINRFVLYLFSPLSPSTGLCTSAYIPLSPKPFQVIRRCNLRQQNWDSLPIELVIAENYFRFRYFLHKSNLNWFCKIFSVFYGWNFSSEKQLAKVNLAFNTKFENLIFCYIFWNDPLKLLELLL